jgi:TRIAP1/MDM35 family protein
MSQSLSKECTPLKAEYDSCFNAWLESYLTPGPRPESIHEQDWVAQRTKAKAKEYDDKCGEVWKAYSACVKVGLIRMRGRGYLDKLIVGPLQRAVKANNLETLIQQAREENPLPDMNSHIDKSRP